MKLLLCPDCTSIQSLTYQWRFCNCGASSGKYLDNSDNVQISGKAILIGFNNTSFADAVKRRNERALSASFPATDFGAFVFPDNYRKVSRT